MERIHARAPGKILWLGNYSLLERPNIGYVSTVDSYVHATVEGTGNTEFSVKTPMFDEAVKGKVDGATGKIVVQAPRELKLVVTAAEMAAKYVVGLGFRAEGFAITTENDPTFIYRRAGDGKGIVKAGLGSSAAVTVATVAAVLHSYGVDVKKDDALHKLAQTAHAVATGKVGSGFDVAAATYGSIVYTRYAPEIISGLRQDCTPEELVSLVRRPWDYSITTAPLPSVFTQSVANFAGESAITVSFVSKVNEFKAKQPDEYAGIIRDIDSATKAAIRALVDINHGKELEANMEEFRSAFRIGRVKAKLLGVLSGAGIEPDDCTALIEESEEKGAFVAKLPGAGGRDSIAALCRDEPSKQMLEKFWAGRKELELLGVAPSNSGYIVEGMDGNKH